MNYYNEFDAKTAAWLRALIDSDLIPFGHVDERSITDVTPSDLAGFTQCHFFAGIGGWSLALRLAGWPEDLPVWTGSCPCQPFAQGGLRLGEADERHLWPVFGKLIDKCRPSVVFGEQVASALGRQWFAGVRADLEGMAYAVGGADLCAAGVGAPHIRQRLYWVADRGRDGSTPGGSRQITREERLSGTALDGGIDGVGRLGDSLDKGLEGHARHGDDRGEPGRQRAQPARSAPPADAPSPWASSEGIKCLDGRERRIPTEPVLFPLAHGIPSRVGLLRGAGNAIVPPLAARFIQAYREARILT